MPEGVAKEMSMSVWPVTESLPDLRGVEGILLSIRISVEPRRLEELLDALAGMSFPVNPEIHHPLPGFPGIRQPTVVEFPAFENRLEEVRNALKLRGFDPASAQVASMLEEIRGARDRAA
jgi:hypothetical protein